MKTDTIEYDEYITEYLTKRAEAMDNFVAIYIKETGLKITEIKMVEYHKPDGSGFELHCEPIERRQV